MPRDNLSEVTEILSLGIDVDKATFIRWFEGRRAACTLLVLIDDATSQLMQMRFVASKNTDSYFEALQEYLNTHGCRRPFVPTHHNLTRWV